MNGLRLEIEPVIRSAEEMRDRIVQLLPEHTGLPKLALGVANAARAAKTVSQRLKRPFGFHRLPVAFLTVALLLVFVWLYIQFIRRTHLTIALPDRDAHALRDRVTGEHRLQFTLREVPGSREASAMVAKGTVDLAFVQGGLPIPRDLPRRETDHPEYVLWFLRGEHVNAGRVRKILTSVEGEGSHSVAQAFLKAWKVRPDVEYLHDWKRLIQEADYAIPADVDAVFVVKDPFDEKTLIASERLAAAGFRLAPADLGARAAQLDYLKPAVIPQGYLQSLPPIPPSAIATYTVTTYLVGRRDLTPRMLSVASRLIEGRPASLTAGSFEGTVSETSEILQGVEAFLGILINIVLAFLALLGFEMLAYRKRFHELNSLVSLISMHQSSKDVLGSGSPQHRRDNLLYLSLCSDLLGLISSISGYYTQENSSLLFNNLPEIIHQRCDGLKINIQLKILHAMIREDSLSLDLLSDPANDPSPAPPSPAIP